MSIKHNISKRKKKKNRNSKNKSERKEGNYLFVCFHVCATFPYEKRSYKHNVVFFLKMVTRLSAWK